MSSSAEMNVKMLEQENQYSSGTDQFLAEALGSSLTMLCHKAGKYFLMKRTVSF